MNNRLKHQRHNRSGTRIYATWQGMRARCEDPNCDGYPGYGGRGIKVCERWTKFDNFFADMGDRPDGMSLDRINNDGNYEPGNCRWATPLEQAANRRRRTDFRFFHFLTHDGVTLSLTEWVRKTGLTRQTICSRISRGWPVSDVLTRAPRKWPSQMGAQQ